MNSKKLAAAIRVLSVPPVMAALFIIALRLGRPDIITSASEMAMMLYFLALVPLLAYPVSMLSPSLREKGREGQRNLAFLLSAVSYVCGWVYAVSSKRNATLCFIFGTYLFSIIILLVFNKLLHLRASGHACSVTGPISLIMCFLSSRWIPLCVLAYALIFWASVKMKRHTVKEFMLGTASCLLAAMISYIIYM